MTRISLSLETKGFCQRKWNYDLIKKILEDDKVLKESWVEYIDCEVDDGRFCPYEFEYFYNGYLLGKKIDKI